MDAPLNNTVSQLACLMLPWDRTFFKMEQPIAKRRVSLLKAAAKVRKLRASELLETYGSSASLELSFSSIFSALLEIVAFGGL